MRKVPHGIAALYSVVPPNRPTRVFKGRLLGKPGKVRLNRARLDYQWLPDGGLRFVGIVKGPLDVDHEISHVRAPRNGAWVEAFVDSTNLGKVTRVEGVFQACVRVGPDRPVRAILFHVPNFHEYVGDPIRSDRTFHRGRLRLKAGEWIVTIDQSSKHRDVQKALEGRGGFGIGHAGLITRVDGSRFKLAQVSELWSSLHFFLTFARGNWCGPIIPVGMGNRRPVWTEWCRWRIKPWRAVRSWFPLLVGEIPQAFEGFQTLWSDQLWNEPLRELVNWYVEANLNAGAAEGALVLAHSGLDLLSWMRLVVQKPVYSPNDFDDFHADKRIRLVLADLGIPGDVPTSIPHAHALMTSENVKDGPELINRLRNAIVHPTPAKRAFLARVPGSSRVEVLQLALHYLELGILAVCGYQGDYLTRLMSNVWRSQATLKVPWATGKP